MFAGVYFEDEPGGKMLDANRVFGQKNNLMKMYLMAHPPILHMSVSLNPLMVKLV